MVSNLGEGPATWLERREKLKAKKYNGNGAGMPLAIAAQLWPTPHGFGTDGHGSELSMVVSGLETEPTPRTAQKWPNLFSTPMWPTPTAQGGTGYMSGSNSDTWRPTLLGAVQMSLDGPPPKITAAEFRGKGRKAAKKEWPTPAARDYRSPNKLPYSQRGGGKKGEQLPNAVGGQLNPTWVEWLMGWPLGWTDLRPLAMDKFRRWSAAHGCPS